MSFLKVVSRTTVLCLSALFVHCSSGPDFEALRKEILDLHRQTIQAHLNGDVGFFTKDIADDCFSVGNGTISHPTREEITANFKDYLGSTTFTEYCDLEDPIVGFSKDGSMAWSVVRVKVAGRSRLESGRERDFDVTWAWITLYRREGKTWIRLGEVSNRME